MRFSPIAVAAVAVALAAAPASAAAAAPIYLVAPSGNSAVNQYVENVPSAKGNVPALSIYSHSHSGSGQASSGAVAPSTQRALTSQGADGTRAAALASATAPPGVRGVSHRRRSGAGTSGSGAGGQGGATGSGGQGTGSTGAGGSPAATPVSGSVVSPTSAVLKAVTGSATHGLGALLPAILVISAIGAALLAVLRRRRASD